VTQPEVLRREIQNVRVAGRIAKIACLSRSGRQPTVVYLHGLGATKEDFADARFSPGFEERSLLAWDAPGCGASPFTCSQRLDLDILVDIAEAVLASHGTDRVHLVGHSLGGLAALLLAERLKERVISFVNIEGNLAASDCYFSRRVVGSGNKSGRVLLDGLSQSVWGLEARSCALYASRLGATLNPDAIRKLCASIVDYSDRGQLLDRFLKLGTRRLFVYGSENEGLPYLRDLKRCGVALAKIEDSGHFPMYSNPVSLWNTVGDFLIASEKNAQRR
jgi:pimeloyl-ACP methyl ester carboxylesterase